MRLHLQQIATNLRLNLSSLEPAENQTERLLMRIFLSRQIIGWLFEYGTLVGDAAAV